MLGLALPTVCILFVAAAFLTLERIAPGRELPHAPGWYGRAVLVNLIQAAISFGTNRLWVDLMSGASLFHLAGSLNPVLQGFAGWFVGTFFFYWWHRVRH
jgi:sterol desaturase/sphingolipid hydroxylase (fatty acid hydroxylase superfamily)